MSQLQSIDRLSSNQITTNRWSLKEAVEGCARAEIPEIALWRHKIEEIGLKESKRIVRDAGIKVSSICRGGMFPAATETSGRKESTIIAAQLMKRLNSAQKCLSSYADPRQIKI